MSVRVLAQASPAACGGRCRPALKVGARPENARVGLPMLVSAGVDAAVRCASPPRGAFGRAQGSPCGAIRDRPLRGEFEGRCSAAARRFG
jgi:hypothetical protein